MGKNIYIVLIINNKYVRWEEFSKESILKDLYDLLKKKYLINKCYLEIGDLILTNFPNERIFDITNNDSITIKVFTKEHDYYLPSHIR